MCIYLTGPFATNHGGLLGPKMLGLIFLSQSIPVKGHLLFYIRRDRLVADFSLDK